VDDVDDWQKSFFEYLRTARSDVGKLIVQERLNKKFPTPEVKEALESAIKEFKQSYSSSV
jgi:F-type H+-transporting ATPase subunit alpha